MTALAATFQPGDLTAPARVLLQVTGAPSNPPVYTSNFNTSDDGWTGDAGTYIYNTTEGAPPNTLEIQSAVGAASSTFSRTITGLVVGQEYMFQVAATAIFGKLAIGVSGISVNAYAAPVGRSVIHYRFTATATSHVIQMKVKPGYSDTNGTFWVDTITVTKTSNWLGTTIRRTDANGSGVLVRESLAGQDTVGTSGSATMTVTDYEAALYGTVSYTVTDGLGDTASATVINSSTGLWLTLPATADPAIPLPPSFVPILLVTAYRASRSSNGSLHKIIGREDPIANPGPLALRTGSFDLWCTDYATAEAVSDLLASGRTGHLRQPDYPGMDLYFIATEVSISPTEQTQPVQRWIASVSFTEVISPLSEDLAVWLDGGVA